MRTIPLPRGLHAIVDDSDYERVVALSPWSVNWCGGRWYAYRKDGNRRNLYMHRFILEAPAGVEVDHINGNGLDNRRSNMRHASKKENVRSRHSTRGSSRYRGVHWDKSRSKWVAQIMVDRKHKFLGRFESETGAAYAYDRAARQFFGEFASPNFDEDTEDVG